MLTCKTALIIFNRMIRPQMGRGKQGREPGGMEFVRFYRRKPSQHLLKIDPSQDPKSGKIEKKTNFPQKSNIVLPGRGFLGCCSRGVPGGSFGRFLRPRGGTITIHRNDYKRFRKTMLNKTVPACGLCPAALRNWIRATKPIAAISVIGWRRACAI